jgi:elongation factor P
MPKVKVTALLKGSYIEHKQKPQQVLSTSFHHPGRGGGVCVMKMKNLVTGNILEETFKSSEQVELLDLNSREMVFLYQDSEDLVFMDPRTYEQLNLPEHLLQNKTKLLIPEIKVYILFDDQKALAINLPAKVTLLVTEAPEAVAGNTVNAAKKTITLETGLQVLAPLFIKKGERVIVDTATLQYASRA